MKKATRSLLCIAILFVTTVSFGQPGDPGDGPPADIPLGGIEILLLGGAGLGIQRIIKSRKRN